MARTARQQALASGKAPEKAKRTRRRPGGAKPEPAPGPQDDTVLVRCPWVPVVALNSGARQQVADDWREWGVAVLEPRNDAPAFRDPRAELNRLRSVVQGAAKALGVGYECVTQRDEDGPYLVAFVKRQ